MEEGKLFAFYFLAFPLGTELVKWKKKKKKQRYFWPSKDYGLVPATFPSIPCGNEAAL